MNGWFWFWLVILLIVLCGCQKPVSEGVPVASQVGANSSRYNSVRVWTDPKTGCEYLVNPSNYGDAMQPRWNAQGGLEGCK